MSDKPAKGTMPLDELRQIFKMNQIKEDAMSDYQDPDYVGPSKSTMGLMTQPKTDSRLQQIERIANSNEFWLLESGEHLNMICDLLDENKRLSGDVEAAKVSIKAWEEHVEQIRPELAKYKGVDAVE